MTARKRRTGEKFKAYRKSLKDEAKWLKGRLLGRIFFSSAPKPDAPLNSKGSPAGTTYRRKK